MASGDTIRIHGRLRGGEGDSNHEEEGTTVRVTVANVTHLATAIDALLAVEGDIYCVQEHTLGPEQLRGVSAILASKQLHMQASPSHKAGNSYAAGVATVTRAPRPLFPIPCRTAEGREQHQQGRIQIIGCGIGERQTITIANVYGWTRGDEDEHQAMRTELLIQTAHRELAMAPDTEPCFLVGDLNASLQSIHAVQQMQASGWTDLGSVYDDAATCFATAQSAGNRRDYILANPAALQLVRAFRVENARNCAHTDRSSSRFNPAEVGRSRTSTMYDHRSSYH